MSSGIPSSSPLARSASTHCTPAAVKRSRAASSRKRATATTWLLVLSGEGQRDGQADLTGRTGDEVTRRRRHHVTASVRRVSGIERTVLREASGCGGNEVGIGEVDVDPFALHAGSVVGRLRLQLGVVLLQREASELGQPVGATAGLRVFDRRADVVGVDRELGCEVERLPARWVRADRTVDVCPFTSAEPGDGSPTPCAPGLEQRRCVDVVEVADTELVRGPRDR